MNCTQTENKLIFFFDNSLSDEESADIRNHLNKCDKCRAKYSFCKEILSQIETEKIKETDPFFFTRLEQKIENIQDSKQRAAYLLKPRFTLRTMMFSIFVALGIISGILIGNFASDVIYPSRDITVNSYEYDLNINEMYDEIIELSFYYK